MVAEARNSPPELRTDFIRYLLSDFFNHEIAGDLEQLVEKRQGLSIHSDAFRVAANFLQMVALFVACWSWR